MGHCDRFADRLIAAEQVDAKRKERYEMEMRQILNQTLTPARRVAYAIGALLGIFVGVDFAILAATTHMTGEYAAWGRAVFGAFAVLGLVWAALAGRIAIRGVIDLRSDRTSVARLVWYNSILICAVALFVSWLNLKYGSGKWSVFTALIGIAYLIAGMLSVVRNLVHQAELRIREKLLEIELRLTDMDEEMRKGRT
ncbi:MAG: hypothetical protein ABSD48_06175 [Armatimonadota bacterium]|jgi:uncharacterized membrane protein YcjF (UPF0283 family)